ncbi:hypothetical protein C4572_01995, partial [Candidatus Parcubacteria bacterium]
MFKKIGTILEKMNITRIWKRRMVIAFIIVVAVAVSSVALFWFEYTGRDEAIAYKSTRFSFVNYIPKILDLYFLPLSFGKSKLSAYEIIIDRDKLNKIYEETSIGYCCNCMPEDADRYVDVEFITDGKNFKASIKPRGDCSNHWGYKKKSWRIKFEEENLFGEKQIDLIIPSDREFVAEYLNNYRAKKFGLVVPEMKFVELKINGI